jgi:hypothetical protein
MQFTDNNTNETRSYEKIVEDTLYTAMSTMTTLDHSEDTEIEDTAKQEAEFLAALPRLDVGGSYTRKRDVDVVFTRVA